MQSRHGLSLLLALATLTLALAPAHLSGQTQPSGTPGPKTSVLLYTPYTAQGLNKDLHSTRTSIGTCNQASQVDVNRPDAWACMVQGHAYDPCFSNFDGSELACPDLPLISNPSLSPDSVLGVVLVHPIPDLDPSSANTPGPDATPFLMELTDGQLCVPEPADIRFAGLPVFGYCTAGYWFGAGDLSKDLWTIPVLQRTGSESIFAIANIGVLRVWY